MFDFLCKSNEQEILLLRCKTRLSHLLPHVENWHASEE